MSKLPAQTVKKLVVEYARLAEGKDFWEVYADGSQATTQESALERIDRLNKKLDKRDKFWRFDPGRDSLKWEYVESGLATMTFKGEEFEHWIQHDIYLVGRIGRYKIWHRFISHPFYQWGCSSWGGSEGEEE